MKNIFDDLFDSALYNLNQAEDAMFGTEELPDGYVRGTDMSDELIEEMVDELYDDFGAEPRKVRFTL